MPGLGFICLLGTFLLVGFQAVCVSAAQVAELGPCSPVEDASGLITLQSDCQWAVLVASSSKQGTRVVSTAGTVTIFGPFSGGDSPAGFSTAGASPGAWLQLERLVLAGFAYAGPGASAPFLWPSGLLQQTGSGLNLTDVRLVTSDPGVFESWLQQLTIGSRTMYWTDNTTFLHIHEWTDGRTTLNSVGLLLQAAVQSPNPLQLPQPVVKNCLVTATNGTLVQALIQNAAVVTPQPLLVYITTNVSIGAFPQVPASGVPLNRPVVFVGLHSLLTSIDFQMAVNQLNATGSKYSNATFVGLVLENLAPGDAVTSSVASPFSIAITNNVWAVFYNRTVPNDTRLAFLNTTLVLPQESEMAYVTYMFTMYTSTLPYLRQQTKFYTDVLHMLMLQFQPGPGSKAVTVNHLRSWYHWWNDVVLTTVPVVAALMPIPPRPITVSSTTRTSPLVQAVHTVQDLRVAAEVPVVGDRSHVLLLLSNIAVAQPDSGTDAGQSSSPIRLQSVMTWVGTSPAKQAAEALPELTHQQQATARQPDAAGSVYVTFGYVRGAAAVLDSAPDDALQLQQLVLGQLPQGPDLTAARALGGAHIPKELWTMLLWCIDRPLKGKSLNLDGVQLQLPQAELKYLQAAAQRSSDFVVELNGDNSAALTFQDVSCTGVECANVHIGAFQGPGMIATNLTLTLDPAAETAIPGYIWPEQASMPTIIPTSSMPAWAIAVVAVCVSLAALLAAVGGFWVWRHKRDAARSKVQLLDPFSKLEAGNVGCRSCHGCSEGLQHVGQKSGRCSRQSSGVCAVHGASSDLSSAVGSGSRSPADSLSSIKPPAKLQGSSAGPVLPNASSDQAVDGMMIPAANLNYAVKEFGQEGLQQHQQSGVTVDEQFPQVPDVSGLRDAHVPVHVAESFADSVAVGMQRWRAAVSSTTMLLMERRMDAALPVGSVSSGSSGSVSRPAGSSCTVPEEPPAEAKGDNKQDGRQPAVAVSLAGSTLPQLQLLELLGQGSFGCVYLASWRGKRVAVKIMQLPANALLGPVDENLQTVEQQPDKGGQQRSLQDRQRQRLARQKQQSSPPHMAVMEAVLSSTMSHPNVVQVYTYTLNPLTSSPAPFVGEGSSLAASSGGVKASDKVAGWELKIIMEYCNKGSLRDALDFGYLCKPGLYLAPSAVLTLAHDLAAALVHLHSEDIVHGDLKAGNVMLTDSANQSCNGASVCSTAGSHRLTAKVADFGLAMPLGPSDTHATLMARGTPTHMSPELFMSGHVSKASDVYAYGILLYEIITGQRAYAGVPIPLLPHEVARQGLRPTWPANLPLGCRDLRKLAEACWAQQPYDRPSFSSILATLDHWTAGGHGWPPTAAMTASTGSCIKMTAPSDNNADASPTMQQPAQQAQHQHDGVDEASAALQLRGADVHVGSLEAVGTPQRRAAAGLRLLAASPASSQQQQLQQQQHADVGAATASAGIPAGPAGSRQSSGLGEKPRNMHMSWSEVNFGLQ